MLFNSYEFIFVFLPLILIGCYFTQKYLDQRFTLALLVVASLIFYAHHVVEYLNLMIFSVVFNYLCALLISKNLDKRSSRAFSYCALGVTVNLGLLGYFKYADFFIETLSYLLDVQIPTLRLILPIAISFYTFQQIAYLIDVYKNEAREPSFLHYAFFVTFFPQLIAGPIVHHKQLIPQLDIFKPFQRDNLAMGLAIFVLGLAKKILIADTMSHYVTKVYDAVDAGIEPSFIESWVGSIGFTFQIYFDFSAYSEMAIGLALILGLRLPVNFMSPYRARSMIEFWRCWHITLSNFLRDYVYIPLGGSRDKLTRTIFNLMSVMLVGGLWHGASWTFVAWGGIHGVALSINHALRVLKINLNVPAIIAFPAMFLYLNLTWVFFKAETFGSAMRILKGMVGMNDVIIPEAYESKLEALIPLLEPILALDFVYFGEVPLYEDNIQILQYLTILAIVWFMPNTLQWTGYDKTVVASSVTQKFVMKRFAFSLSPFYAVFISTLALLSVLFMYHGEEFLYFQF